MNFWAFDTLPLWAMSLTLGVHLVLGTVIGVVYFRSVRHSAALFATGGHALMAIALTLGRLLFAGGFLALTSLEGALPLLVSALGLLVARFLVMRRQLGRQ